MGLLRTVNQIIFLLITHGSLYGSAHWFFGKHLYKDYEVKLPYVRHLFSLTFTVSVSMLQLLLFELLDLFVVELRRLVWKIDFMLMIALVYLILPIGSIYSVTSLLHKSWRFCAGVCIFALPPLWFAFYQAGHLIQLPPTSDMPILGSFFPQLSTELLFARIGVCGVVVVAALGGYGSVLYPYENISLFLTVVRKSEALELETRLRYTLDLIASKKSRLALVNRTIVAKNVEIAANGGGRQLENADATEGVGWLMRATKRASDIFRATLGGGEKRSSAEKEAQTLEEEIITLETVMLEIFEGYQGLLEDRCKSLYAATFWGGVKNLLGWIMSGVCVYRVIFSIINVVFRRRQSGDVASNALKKICYYVGLPSVILAWAPYVNLVLLGWLIAMNIRGFVDRLLAVFRLFSTAGTSNMFALLMSEIMGLYFCAYTVLLRVYLPEEYREALKAVMGPSLDFDDFHWTSDWVGVIACLLTLGHLAISHLTRYSKYKTL